MTIITNPLASLVKKGLIIGRAKITKVDEPLVDNALNEKHAADKKAAKGDVEGGPSSRHYFVLHSHARRVSATTTVCVFLTALLVTTLGIVGGVYLFNQVNKSQAHRFRGWCKIPYPSFSFLTPPNSPRAEAFNADLSNDLMMALPDEGEWPRGAPNNIKSGPFPESFFDEEFEIDEANNYEKIEVPNFGKGRRGRFIHDFGLNKTGIVDIDRGLCFVMALDRETVFPPRNLWDAFQKAQQNYYEVDTRFVRKTMVIVVPAITDYRSVGHYISEECRDIPTYLLKKVSTNVVKRSVETSDENAVHYMHYAGKHVVDLTLMNMEVLE